LRSFLYGCEDVVLRSHDQPDSREVPMHTSSLAEAKAQLSKLIELVEGGE
jgi:hypothetical protein